MKWFRAFWMHTLHRQPDYKRWIGFILAFRLLMFSWFTMQFQSHWLNGKMEFGFVVWGGDTSSYLEPAEALARTGDYDSMCRMPGFVPIYTTISAITGPETARAAFVILQVILSIISCFLIGRTAMILTSSALAFRVAVILFSLSSFVVIWDHFLLSDSFSVYFMIIALYLTARAGQGHSTRNLIIASFFLTWSMFLRPIGVFLFPAFALVWFWPRRKQWKTEIGRIALAALVPIVFLALWNGYTSQRFGKAVGFTEDLSKCFTTNLPPINAIGQLAIAWGEDYQKWSRGSVSAWLLGFEPEGAESPIPSRVYTSVCNADSMVTLKSRYAVFAQMRGTPQGDAAGEQVIASVARFMEAYKREHAVDYYVINKLRLLRLFYFPKRLDNLPGPPRHEMNAAQLVIKAGYFALLLLVNVLAVWAAAWLLWRRSRLAVWAVFPFVLVGVLACFFGFVEQRYFVPVYALNILLISLAVSELASRHRAESAI